MTSTTGTPILVSDGTSAPLHRATDLPERWLQELIHRHPTCLPMDEIEPGIGRLVSVCMELPLRVGSVGWQRAIMVEVKLCEARRKVVAQALEYATALFKLTPSWKRQSGRRTSTESRPVDSTA